MNHGDTEDMERKYLPKRNTEGIERKDLPQRGTEETQSFEVGNNKE